MKRDMDLVRKLLLLIEEEGHDRNGWIEEIAVEGYTDLQVSQHIWLLGNGGFIEIIDLSAEETCYRPRCLTWRGTEFVETVRDRDIWDRTKSIAGRVGTGSLSMLMEIATKVAQEKLTAALG
jgi:hypothetical protein